MPGRLRPGRAPWPAAPASNSRCPGSTSAAMATGQAVTRLVVVAKNARLLRIGFIARQAEAARGGGTARGSAAGADRQVRAHGPVEALVQSLDDQGVADRHLEHIMHRLDEGAEIGLAEGVPGIDPEAGGPGRARGSAAH